MSLNFFSKYLILVILMMLVGCSSDKNPVNPGNTLESPDDIPVFGLYHTGKVFEAIGILGAYELTLDIETMTADLTLKRSSTIGESYVVSGINFFTLMPCSDCLKLVGFREDTEKEAIALTFHITHPFEPGDVLLPPSSTNRKDLDVFDPAMVIKPLNSPSRIFPLTGAEIYPGVCVDPDGYTSELEYMFFDPGALPYFLVVDDTDRSPIQQTWNRFAMGTDSTFDVYFADTRGGTKVFDMYLTMGYGASANRARRLYPKYYNPEFNRKSAWKVIAEPPNKDDPPEIGNTWVHNDYTTPFDVTVTVYDWQIDAVVWDGVNPTDFDDATTRTVYAASEIEKVTVEVPGMTSSLPQSSTPVSGDGSLSNPYVYIVSFPNENGISWGDYTGLVKVHDTRATGPPGERDFLIDSPDGFTLKNYNIAEFVTYQAFPATVVFGCGPITGLIEDPECPIDGQYDKQIENFTVSANSGHGGDPIVLYEVDYDYHEGVFDVDDTSTTGIFTGHVFSVPEPCDYYIPYTFNVAFRATDSCDPPNKVIFATCGVTVAHCCTVQELSYNFDGCDGMTCMGWEAGGCNLNNSSSWGYGSFSWRCPTGDVCDGIIEYPYINSSWNPNRSLCADFHYYASDMNVVSPVINLPHSEDGILEWDWCMFRCSDCVFRLYISENSCAGPWELIWSSISDNCHENQTIYLSIYEGSNIRFRFQYTGSDFRWGTGMCGAAGVKIDNVIISGCFSGNLTD